MGGKIDYTPPRFQGNQWRVDIGILWVLFIFFYHFLSALVLILICAPRILPGFKGSFKQRTDLFFLVFFNLISDGKM